MQAIRDALPIQPGQTFSLPVTVDARSSISCATVSVTYAGSAKDGSPMRSLDLPFNIVHDPALRLSAVHALRTLDEATVLLVLTVESGGILHADWRQ